MYCQKCGSQNPDGASFCQSCGAPLAAAAAPPPPSAPPAPSPARPVPVSESVYLGPLQIPQSLVSFTQYLLPAGAVLMFLGSFLPWIRVYGFGTAGGFSAGVHRLGILTFLLALGLGAGYAALLLLPKEQTTAQNIRSGALIALAVVLVCVIGVGISVGRDVSQANAFIKLTGIGIGFHMTWLGALMACASGLWIWFRE